MNNQHHKLYREQKGTARSTDTGNRHIEWFMAVETGVSAGSHVLQPHPALALACQWHGRCKHTSFPRAKSASRRLTRHEPTSDEYRGTILPTNRPRYEYAASVAHVQRTVVSALT